MNPKNFLELKIYIFINIVFSTGFRIFAIPHLHRTYSDSPKLSNFADCVSISYFASCHLSCEIATMDNGRIRTLVSANVPRVLRCSRWGSFIRVDKVPKRDLRRLRPPASSAYHIDNALRLMRNNYNLFAHHSKTKKKKKRYLSARCLSSTPTPPYSLPFVPAHPLQKCRFQLFTQWRMWPLMMTTKKQEKKRRRHLLHLFVFCSGRATRCESAKFQSRHH